MREGHSNVVRLSAWFEKIIMYLSRSSKLSKCVKIRFNRKLVYLSRPGMRNHLYFNNDNFQLYFYQIYSSEEAIL